ncbi:MAG: Stk1 family PASTA domain-containing Ser/Thr kinase [Clostridia bacterium]|nr:Stk1 family PASTA domain-containing Ser/Thr kinase [Clostridia bacterium]
MSLYEQYIGRILNDRYRIDALLGVGGMAAVMQAFDLKEGQKVAVKMLREEIADDKQAVRRFITESKAVAMLDHPNIVKIHDVVLTDEIKYIVMGYIEGDTLRDYMDKVKQIPLHKAIDIALQILDALEHAHDKGVVHRDIKPQNILLLKNGKVVVSDFGIAKIADSETVSDEKTVGTVYYISPEQATGSAVNHLSDLYSLGVMLFEMLTGKLPFYADTTISIAMMHINDEPPSARDLLPTIPVGMEQIISYALAKDPGERFQSAKQMKAYLEALKSDPFAEFAIAPKDQYRIQKEEEAKNAKRKKEESEKKEKEQSKSKKRKKKEYREEEVRFIRGDSWSPMPSLLGISLAFVLVLVVAGFYIFNTIFLDSSLNVFKDNSGENVTIEDYVGKPFTQTDQAYLLEEVGYQKVIITEKYSDSVEKGLVISQEPKGGEVRKLSSVQLEIVISKGSDFVENTFPDYSMEDYRTVRLQLIDQGYEVEMIPVTSSAVDSCLILKTEPAAGSKVVEGMKVTVYYSTGPKATDVIYTFPQFVGMSLNQVVYYIDTYQLNVVSVRYEYSATVSAGAVISSSVSAGPKPKLTPISLVISKGVDPSTVIPEPDVQPSPTPDVQPDQTA